jgi:hypothetical protein
MVGKRKQEGRNRKKGNPKEKTDPKKKITGSPGKTMLPRKNPPGNYI